MIELEDNAYKTPVTAGLIAEVVTGWTRSRHFVTVRTDYRVQVLLFVYMIILFSIFVIQFSVACACLVINADQQAVVATQVSCLSHPLYKLSL